MGDHSIVSFIHVVVYMLVVVIASERDDPSSFPFPSIRVSTREHASFLGRLYECHRNV